MRHQKSLGKWWTMRGLRRLRQRGDGTAWLVVSEGASCTSVGGVQRWLRHWSVQPNFEFFGFGYKLQHGPETLLIDITVQRCDCACVSALMNVLRNNRRVFCKQTTTRGLRLTCVHDMHAPSLSNRRRARLAWRPRRRSAAARRNPRLGRGMRDYNWGGGG